MENLKLIRKVKKISLRNAQREIIEQQLAANLFAESLNEIDRATHTNEEYFNKLSDELVLQIFKWISRPLLLRYARVCKRWYNLMFDESLWKRFDLSNKTAYSEIMIRLLNRGVKIFSLSRGEIRKTTRKALNLPEHGIINLPTQLDFHLSNLIKLEILDLTEAVIDKNSLNAILKHCKYLKKISLESLELNNETFNCLSQNIQIETLNLCLAKGVVVDGLILILNALKKLRNLNVAWCNLERESVVLLCKHLSSTVERLNLSGCKTTLLDNDVHSLVISCPYLIELDLSDAQSITCLSVKTIANRLLNLEKLAFSRCYSIQPSSYFHLSNLNHLESIDLFNILKEKSFNVLKSYIPSLKYVNKHPFSSIARPLNENGCIWDLRVIEKTIRD